MYIKCMNRTIPYPEFGAFLSTRLAAWAKQPGRGGQAEFGRAIGVDRSFVSRLCTGESRLNPSMPSFAAACRVLDLSPDDARHLMELCGIDLSPLDVDGSAQEGAADATSPDELRL